MQDAGCRMDTGFASIAAGIHVECICDDEAFSWHL